MIDELENLVENSGRLPWFGRKAVNHDEIAALIARLREVVPQEVKTARQTASDRDLIIQEARETAQRIVQAAEEQRARLLDEHDIVQEASARGQAVLDRAQVQAEAMRADARGYARAIVEKVETLLVRLGVGVEDAKRTLAEEAPAPSAQPAAATADLGQSQG